MQDGTFDLRAEDYRRARPTYPAALFRALAELCVERSLALDCGTGSGQAATGLARWFDQVIGSDTSARQVALAETGDHVAFTLADAGATPLANQSVDLVTVAAAIHWFDLDAFYREAKRVLVPGGVIAVFSYFATNTFASLQQLIDRYADEIVGDYWDPRIALVRNHYRELPFPFEEIPFDDTLRDSFAVRQRYGFERLISFLRTWSASQACERQTGKDPIAPLLRDLRACWGSADEHELCWPLWIRCGRYLGQP